MFGQFRPWMYAHTSLGWHVHARSTPYKSTAFVRRNSASGEEIPCGFPVTRGSQTRWAWRIIGRNSLPPHRTVCLTNLVTASPSKNLPCNVCFVCANPEMSCVSANLLLVLRTYTKSNLSAPYLASRDPFVFRGGLAPQKRSLAQTRLDSCGRMVPKVPFPPLARPCRDTPALSLSDKGHQTSIPKIISRKRSCPARLHISGKPPSP